MSRKIRNALSTILGSSGYPVLKGKLVPRRSPLVLGYHTLNPPEFLRRVLGIQFTPELFESQMDYLVRHHSVISVETLLDWIEGRTVLPPNPVAVTFDDGYRDLVDVALPVLRHRCIPATVFVVTGCAESRRSIWTNRLTYMISLTARSRIRFRLPELADESFALDSPQTLRRSALKLLALFKKLPNDRKDPAMRTLAESLDVDPESDPVHLLPMVTPDQVRILSENGFTIGSHTVNHPILSCCTEAVQKCELRDSKSSIETWTGRLCSIAAYPNGQPGDFTAETRSIAEKLGYRACFTFHPHPIRPGIDRFEIPRHPLMDIPLNRFATALR
ncbi:polysaccharide deacetylase family protein [bacterium]|nr:polysaccharide deacetylase family protein [candidate division CSSED10-310 bacterium]